MNIALISNEYPPFNNFGGIATFMAGLAKLLTKSGHQVIVFTDGGNSLTNQTTIDGVTIVPFLNRRNNELIRAVTSFFPYKLFISILQKYSPATSQLLRYNLLAFFTFISYRDRAKLRVIHAPVLFAPALLISFVFPTITIVTHAQGPDELLQPYDSITADSRFKALLETFSMKRAQFIVSCSRAIMQYLKKYQKNQAKLVCIPNFIDTKMFRSSLHTPDTNTLLSIGRLEYRKGPDLVVKAFSKLAQQYTKMNLIFLGEDLNAWTVRGKQSLFSEYVKSLNLPLSIRRRITFVPRIDDRQRLIDFLETHGGIALLPSRYEPFGFVFIETMMAGYITVASKRGGGAEIIQNGVDGFVVEPTVNDIVACVQRIKCLPKRQLTLMTSRARQHIISTYDISRVESFYQKLYSFFSTRH